MNNYEKYQDLVHDAIISSSWCKIGNKAFGSNRCDDRKCQSCREYITKWLKEEYKEPQIDWSKVPVDTPIIITTPDKECKKRYFSKYVNDRIYAFGDGTTSWSAEYDSYWSLSSCEIELANEEDIKKYSF